jgi:dephospho-CoA kinase
MIIGLTGGIGVGKSVVAKILESMGFAVFYSDFEAKELVNRDEFIRKELSELVNEDLYQTGELDRKRLAALIFGSSQLRAQVNNVIHPRVRAHFKAFCDAQPDQQLIFNEAAILFETGAYNQFDKNVLVTAPDKLRIHRVMKRDSISEQEVHNRINAQWSDDKKRALADFVIVNDEQKPLLDQVEKMVDQLISS